MPGPFQGPGLTFYRMKDFSELNQHDEVFLIKGRRIVRYQYVGVLQDVHPNLKNTTSTVRLRTYVLMNMSSTELVTVHHTECEGFYPNRERAQGALISHLERTVRNARARLNGQPKTNQPTKP